MTSIVISPWCRPLRNGKRNAKDYPYWRLVVSKLREKGIHTIQIGVNGEQEIGADEVLKNKTFPEILKLLEENDLWIGADNFLQHFVNTDVNGKKGIVVFSQSNPKYFGHSQNINLFKDEKFFRKDQFQIWEQAEFKEEAFVEPEAIVKAVEECLKEKSS